MKIKGDTVKEGKNLSSGDYIELIHVERLSLKKQKLMI